MKVIASEHSGCRDEPANSSDNSQLLGVIKLDRDDVSKKSSETAERETVMPFMVDDPACWSLPICKTVAKGANAVANKVPTPAAARGILEAARRLDGCTNLIIGGCGYMWASRKHLYGQTSTPVLTSALEFVDLALRMTKLPVGIITWDAVPLVPLLKDQPGFERLRFVSIRDLPDCANWVLDPCALEQPCGWRKERMAQQLAERLAEAFGKDGVFHDVGILVLECTLLPDFRKTIRSVTPIPVLDLLHFAKAALE
ncbi:hypothetical protein [Paraburkholderia sp. BL9I2N2]|uniref:hypothetical protein n=1 Tax=Paraburkholderia sp. BL9I2N2 TaxID=1938809 RepID=UPI0010E5773E|nr:hypothetical protein [Paraburkholderia sp. BL9I2N2]TCK94644.1 hypothetical protein B0G74_1234 [Paraburkholderia sp. BL9I2N2]